MLRSAFIEDYTSIARVAAMQKVAQDLIVKPLRLPAGIFFFGIQATLPDPFAIGFEDTARRRVRLLPAH